MVFRLNAKDERLEIQSQSQGIGEQIAKIPFDGTLSETLQLIFNPRYILEGASVLSGNKIKLFLNSPSTPIRITSEVEQNGYTYIVMPIRK